MLPVTIISVIIIRPTCFILLVCCQLCIVQYNVYFILRVFIVPYAYTVHVMWSMFYQFSFLAAIITINVCLCLQTSNVCIKLGRIASLISTSKAPLTPYTQHCYVSTQYKLHVTPRTAVDSYISACCDRHLLNRVYLQAHVT